MLRSRLKPRVAASIRYASSTVRNAFAVVIGGGVAGGSTAFHLTRRNIKDVILVESRDIASPQATSFHSPGLVSSSHPAHRYKPILAYSVDLYSRIGQETGVEVEFSKSGTLRLATNNTRLDEFRRYAARDYYQQGDVCKTTLISKEEVKKLAPILDDSSILGALRTEGDGSINARQLTKALVKGAVDQGATLLAGVRPVGIKWEAEHSQWRIHLSDGSEILTRNVVNAAGSFANDVARLSGHTLPISIVEHQYAVLTPSSPPPPSLPSIVDHDSTFYVRQAGEQLLFGGFEAQDRVVFREDWYRKGVEPGGSASVQPDFARLDVAWQRAQELIPSLKNAKIEARAASFSMTSDGYPLVGPYDKNYWLSTGFLDGVSSGGGIGKYLADWMVDGEPPQELFDTDANRFDRWTNRQYILTKSRESYSMYYNWSYLNRLAGRPTDRISGIYGKLKKEKARFSFRNGWEVPLAFELEDEEDELACLVREYQMVTNRCGLIDLSWKGKLELKGPDSIALLDYALANKVPRLGEITSAFMLTRQGRVLSPLKVFHHDNVRSQFILLTEPERESRDMYWLIRAAAEKGFDVQVSSVSEYLASLALVGPLSRDILSLLTKSDVSDAGLPMRTTRLLRLGLVAVVCARSSTSTGQLSYELFHNRADTLKLYEAIMRVGADHGIVNFGQRTMNSMRLEHGYKIWGRELTLDTNPFEVGLGHLVDFDKKDFIGRSSAFELKDKTFDRRLTLLQLDANRVEWKNIPQGMEVVRKKGEEKRIGQITSGSFSVRLQKPLAFAWVDKDVTPNDVLTIDLGTGDTPTEGRILEQIPSTPID